MGGPRRDLAVEIELRVAQLFRLDGGDLAWILRECHHDVADLGRRAFVRDLPPKGFWRVDRRRNAGERLSNQILARVR